MLKLVNLIFWKMMALLLLWVFSFSVISNKNLYARSPINQMLVLPDPSHYDFSYDDMDRILQLIETHRNMKPFHATLDYGVMFYPENDLTTNELTLVAKACIIFPYEAVPLNLPGNYFRGILNGANFFDDGFKKTFKQSPRLANGAAQAYTFATLYENQIQVLLSTRGTIGIKAYQVKVDYGYQVSPATTSIFYNLNLVNDVPGVEFGSGAKFLLAFPCPPFWRE